jgi:cytochrome c-type biogenesis protein CcmH
VKHWLLLIPALLAVLFVALVVPAVAVDEQELAALALDEPMEGLAEELGPPGPVPEARQAEELARHISKGLRCPICQGGSIQESPVDSAKNMRRRVRELVDRGYDEDQIFDYFVRRYGDWVLMSPTTSGFNWLVWLGPAVAAGLALAALAYVVTRWSQEPDAVPLENAAGEAPLDRYEQRLLDEIES